MSSLHNELDFWHFDKDFMVYKDGSLGAGFKITGFDITCATDEAINLMTRSLENLIISGDEGLKFQLFYKLSPNVNHLIDGHKNLSQEIKGPYQKIVDARINFLKSNQASGNYFVPEIYFFIRSKGQSLTKKGLLAKSENYEQVTKESFSKFREKFDRIVKGVKTQLASGKFEPELLTNDKWFDLIFEHLNFDRVNKFGRTMYKHTRSLFDESINEQVLLTDFLWDKKSLKLGDYKFRTISLATLPEGQTFAAMANIFSSVPFHFWISQSIHLLDQSKEKNTLELKRRIAHSMASGSKNVSDLESENKLGQIEGLLQNLLTGSEKLVSADFTVIIWGKTKSELDNKADEILKTFRSMNQSEGIQETLASKQVFINSIPGACRGLRHKKMKSSNLSHLMPVFSSWTGNKRPVCLLPTRDGNLFSLDPYADHLPAWNGIVFGGTGSGKSYTVVQLMSMFLGKARRNKSGDLLTPRVVWIDNGASSKKLIEVLGGEFLDLNLNSKMCLNMFDLKDGEKRPGPDRIRTVLAVLEMILKDEEARSLGKREKALLEEQVVQVYMETKNRTPILSDLKLLLDKHKDVRMRHFGEILYSWTGDSPYGKMLDGQSTVKLSKDIVSIEVQHLSNYPDLKDVLLLLLTSYIQDVASSDIEREYLLIIDEAERLFQSELAKQVVITCYRTWRKFKSGIWCLSQNHRDFMADKALKDALMPNTTSVIILRQRKIDWDDFKKTFDFNDTQVDRIKSLNIKKGEYGEFYYLQDEKEAILRLIPEPLSHWIASSDANDKTKIYELEKEYPNLSKLEILEKLAFNQ